MKNAVKPNISANGARLRLAHDAETVHTPSRIMTDINIVSKGCIPNQKTSKNNNKECFGKLKASSLG